MPGITIKLFLPSGDAKGLRIASISNWTGVALAAPRTEIESLLARDECERPGVYLLLGRNPDTDALLAYIGEAEVIRERLRQHRSKEFWVHAIVFVSKDETLTKAHVRYLESRLIAGAEAAGRVSLEQNKAGGAKLPESDREDMEVYLSHVHRLLPLLGFDILTPVSAPSSKSSSARDLVCRIKGVEAHGRRSPDGFVILSGSTAVRDERPSASRQHPFVLTLRRKLLADGTLIERNGVLTFTKDAEFSSPSAAAAVIHGGGANGLTEWRSEDGRTLKELDEQA